MVGLPVAGIRWYLTEKRVLGPNVCNGETGSDTNDLLYKQP